MILPPSLHQQRPCTLHPTMWLHRTHLAQPTAPTY
jgi:hypothetical protein